MLDQERKGASTDVMPFGGEKNRMRNLRGLVQELVYRIYRGLEVTKENATSCKKFHSINNC